MRCLVTAHDTHEGGPVPPQRPSLRQKNRSPQLFCKRLDIQYWWSGRLLPTVSRCSKVVLRFNPLKEEASVDGVVIIGIDLAKRIFQVHGARKDDSVAFRRKLSRGKLLGFLASRPRCMVAIEARAIGPVSLVQIVAAGHGACVWLDRGAARVPDCVVVGAGGLGFADAVHSAPGFALGSGPESRSVLRAPRQRGRGGGARFARGSRQVRPPYRPQRLEEGASKGSVGRAE